MKFWESLRDLELGLKIRPCECINTLPMDKETLYRFIAEQWSDDLQSLMECEWSSFKEIKPTYSFQEMLQKIKDGKRFRRKNWENCEGYIFWYQGIIVHGLIVQCNSLMEEKKFTFRDICAEDWIEVD